MILDFLQTSLKPDIRLHMFLFQSLHWSVFRVNLGGPGSHWGGRSPLHWGIYTPSPQAGSGLVCLAVEWDPRLGQTAHFGPDSLFLAQIVDGHTKKVYSGLNLSPVWGEEGVGRKIGRGEVYQILLSSSRNFLKSPTCSFFFLFFLFNVPIKHCLSPEPDVGTILILNLSFFSPQLTLLYSFLAYFYNQEDTLASSHHFSK